jgi:DNA-binding NarL/FixJ family response regulator
MSYKRVMAITVAIVEDDLQARRIFARWISRAPGFRLVAEWGDAESALEPLVAGKPDVVLMDINLPGMTGVAAVKQLKPRMESTQFVMLTVYEDPNHIYEALAAGATGYLLKETSRDGLLGAVQEVHQGGSPITSNIARKVVQFFHRKAAAEEVEHALSPREEEVLKLVTQGYRYKEIADKLNISVPSVNTYIRRTYEKLHVCCRAEAVARFTSLSQRDITSSTVAEK